MAKKPIYGTDPEKILRLLSIGEDGKDVAEDQGDLENSPVSNDVQAGKHAYDSDSCSTASTDEIIERLHTCIEGYRIIKVLGEGGMGIVYLAEQQYPVRRQVALKVMKPGMDSKRVLARFEAEQQTLAWLDHPNIAKVFDAGTTETGCSFFVMEYVEGIAITDFCDRHRLGIRDRLRLFSVVCQAVQHAHQKGIIHRDIKPSNILVAEQDGQPMPKIIDFGVAKAMGEPLTECTLKTEDSQLLGTPEYMSPEQADMAQELIDTRSDVYSLGVLLYVLLAGALPFEPDVLRKGGIENIRKTIRETDPRTPSTRLANLGEEAAKVAERRSTEISTLAKHLKNELEWIPLKAMRKERSERYRSASELADDIENYLNGAPLIAGPPTTLYRFKKFVRRNAVLSAAVLAVGVTLFLGLAATTAMYLRAESALGREARARIEAQAIAGFLTKDVLGSARQVVGRDATAMDLLDAASVKLDEGVFKDQPHTELLVRYRLGNLIKELGYPKKAIPYLERVQEIFIEHGAPEPLSSHLIMHYLAMSCLHSGDLNKAETLFHQIIQEKHKNHRMSGPDLYTYVKQQLAGIYNIQARYEESERTYFETMSLQFPKGKTISPGRKLGLMSVLAETYRAQGRYEQAEQLLIKVLNIDQSRIVPRENRARLYLDQGRHRQAEAAFREVIEDQKRRLPGEGIHRYTLPNMNGLAEVYTKQGRFVEAESLFQEIRETQKEKLGGDHWETLETLNDFGVLRREQQRYGEAESLLQQALDGRKLKLGADHPACFESMHELGILYKEQQLYDKAEPLLREAVEGRRLKLGDTHPHTQESLDQLTDLYEAWGKPREVERFRVVLKVAEKPEE